MLDPLVCTKRLRDGIAKIGRFLTIDDGAIGGVAQLDMTQLNAALQKTASDRGLVPLTDYHYNNGFWALNAQTNLGCCAVRFRQQGGAEQRP